MRAVKHLSGEFDSSGSIDGALRTRSGSRPVSRLEVNRRPERHRVAISSSDLGVLGLDVASRTKRREARQKRRRRAGQSSPKFDPHAEAIVDSLASMEKLIAQFSAAEDLAAVIEAAFNEAVAELVERLRRFDAVRLIEVARLAFLPIVPVGETAVDTEASAAKVELLALIALAAQQEAVLDVPNAEPVEEQEMSGFVSDAKDELDALLHLAQLRTFIAVDPNDKLAMVSLLIRASEVLMRNPSYPTMLAATNLELFDDDPIVRTALKEEVGFDASDAQAVLNACDHLQHVNMNDRMDAMRQTTSNAMSVVGGGEPDEELKDLLRTAFMSMFEPDADKATVAIEDIVAHTGVAEEAVAAVIERFRVDFGTDTVAEVVDAFTTGKNPMRTRPLIISDTGRVMLPHNALNAVAVRENLEEHLKTSTVWSKYAKHRGDLLETRTRAALDRLLPGAHFRDGFEYYVPANDAERETNDPGRFTKRVEGDHLVVLDDVAIIVEDKAVALSALSRGGKTTRIRTDLTGIITKAADQAGRIRDGIERDGGLRIEREGWVDLRHIREIHTIAVSLDDLSAVLSATAELVRAGLLALDNIPWTVSLHDLELIVELVDRPAEFLLYLRRRRHPDVTVMFRASDELDLFLHFFEAGLWVEPDPTQVRRAFPFLPEPTTAELRRFRSQQPALLTSRTDQLDSWYYAKDGTDEDSGFASKPTMVASPIESLIGELQSRRVTGWLSISATLLSCSTTTQHQLARFPDELLNNPSPNGVGRSLTLPLTASVDPAEGWLVVLATRTPGSDPAETEKKLRDYLRAKKHQLSLPRGVVFLYDELTRDLVDVCYDGHIGPLDAALTASLKTLRPASEVQKQLHPNAFRLPNGTKRTPRRTAKKKRKR